VHGNPTGTATVPGIQITIATLDAASNRFLAAASTPGQTSSQLFGEIGTF
jgi:hypothetical protein